MSMDLVRNGGASDMRRRLAVMDGPSGRDGGQEATYAYAVYYTNLDTPHITFKGLR